MVTIEDAIDAGTRISYEGIPWRDRVSLIVLPIDAPDHFIFCMPGYGIAASIIVYLAHERKEFAAMPGDLDSISIFVEFDPFRPFT